MKPEDRIRKAGPLDTGRDDGAHKLEDVRRELAELGERLDALSTRVEEVAPTKAVGGRRFRGDSSIGSSESLRVLAMRMAVRGTSRRVAERRLRGTAPPAELKQILDEAYGHRAAS